MGYLAGMMVGALVVTFLATAFGRWVMRRFVDELGWRESAIVAVVVGVALAGLGTLGGMGMRALAYPVAAAIWGVYFGYRDGSSA